MTGCTLANYLGTGENPRIILELGANGAGWKSFTIDYRGTGDIPYSHDPASQWVAWNVKDTQGHYYGTINLAGSNGSSVAWSSYEAGTDGYYLDGIELGPAKGQAEYQLTVERIITPAAGKGPFPDAPLARPATHPGSSEPIVLSVVGDTIVDDKGQAILLKGLVRPSLEWNPQGEHLGPDDVANMRAWGANVIRVDLYQGYWFASEAKTVTGSYKQIVDALIYYAISHGMAVILDLHWTEAGHQSPMANHDSLTFWKQVAAEYKGFGTVLFELFNEPYQISKEVWLHGDATFVGYQQLHDAVRSAGADNICICAGLDYGYDLSFVDDDFRVQGYDIVYCSHPYDDKGTAQAPPTFDRNFAGVLGKHPIIFTEFGGNSPGTYDSPEVYRRILAYADAHSISYTGFAWYVKNDEPWFPSVISSWSGTPAYGGVFVHDDTVAKPGTPLDRR